MFLEHILYINKYFIILLKQNLTFREFHFSNMLLQCIQMILILNGLYDITCALSILFLTKYRRLGYFSKIHMGLFIEENDAQHPILRRFIAYWIMSYGLTRLYAGMMYAYKSPEVAVFASLTYISESIGFENEANHYDTVHKRSVSLMTIITVIICGLLTLDTYHLTVPGNS